MPAKFRIGQQVKVMLGSYDPIGMQGRWGIVKGRKYEKNWGWLYKVAFPRFGRGGNYEESVLRG